MTSLGAYSKGTLFEGGYEKFPFSGHIPVEVVLLTNYLFDATHASNRIFLRDRQVFVN